MSPSTATMARASARVTRPAGPGSWPSSLNKAVSDSLEIRLEAARVEHADLFLAMMGALEEADPGDTPFDQARRLVIFEEFVRDDTYGRAWLILADEEPVGYIVLTVS